MLTFRNIGKLFTVMSKINEKILLEYEELQRNLPNIIKSYGITVSHICKQANIPRSTYEDKIRKDNAFSLEEMKRIVNVINNVNL